MFQKYFINLSVFPKKACNHNVMLTVTVAYSMKATVQNNTQKMMR
jgi:hypothetical protein